MLHIQQGLGIGEQNLDHKAGRRKLPQLRLQYLWDMVVRGVLVSWVGRFYSFRAIAPLTTVLSSGSER